MSNIKKAMKDWTKEMKKKAEYFPSLWPTEDILKWGGRMEDEKKKYDLSDEEWLALETKKTELCLLYGRDPIDPSKNIKCPKYDKYDYHGPAGMSTWNCWSSHPWDEDIYTCNLTGRYPCCEYGMITQADLLKYTKDPLVILQAARDAVNKP